MLLRVLPLRPRLMVGCIYVNKGLQRHRYRKQQRKKLARHFCGSTQSVNARTQFHVWRLNIELTSRNTNHTKITRRHRLEPHVGSFVDAKNLTYHEFHATLHPPPSMPSNYCCGVRFQPQSLVIWWWLEGWNEKRNMKKWLLWIAMLAFGIDDGKGIRSAFCECKVWKYILYEFVDSQTARSCRKNENKFEKNTSSI